MIKTNILLYLHMILTQYKIAYPQISDMEIGRSVSRANSGIVSQVMHQLSISYMQQRQVMITRIKDLCVGINNQSGNEIAAKDIHNICDIFAQWASHEDSMILIAKNNYITIIKSLLVLEDDDREWKSEHEFRCFIDFMPENSTVTLFEERLISLQEKLKLYRKKLCSSEEEAANSLMVRFERSLLSVYHGMRSMYTSLRSRWLQQSNAIYPDQSWMPRSSTDMTYKLPCGVHMHSEGMHVISGRSIGHNHVEQRSEYLFKSPI